jgi:hypothetical protein
MSLISWTLRSGSEQYMYMIANYTKYSYTGEYDLEYSQACTIESGSELP